MRTSGSRGASGPHEPQQHDRTNDVQYLVRTLITGSRNIQLLRDLPALF